MMTKRWYYWLLGLGIAGVIALAVYLAGNSQINISGASIKNGELTATSDFPNATCRKILRLGFPPFRLECKEKETSK
jgi:hypothetical protein